jgi:hypothetical protein
MTLTTWELESVKSKVIQKVSFILSNDVYNNLTEQEKEEKRLALTEKFLDQEFDKANDKPLPTAPSKKSDVATAIID